MASPRDKSFDIGHPAPDRGNVSGWTLLFALGGGAFAWSAQIAINSAIAGAACAMGAGLSHDIAAPDWAQMLTAIVNLLAMLVALGALALSYMAMRRTQHRAGRAGVIDAGEGRTRFMAIWGIFAGILFTLAIGFNTISVFWRGLCGD